VSHAALDGGDRSSGVELVPMPVKRLGCDAELYDEVTGEILRFDLTALLFPQA
jgi:hypothetical protein